MLNNVNIAKKIYLLAGIGLLFVVIVGGKGYWGAATVGDLLHDYRSSAQAQMLVSNIVEDFLEARVAALKYRIDPAEAHAAEVESNLAEIVAAEEELEEIIRDPALKETLLGLSARTTEYGATFADSRVAEAGAAAELFAKLDTLGPEIVDQVDAIQDSLQDIQNTLGPAALAQTAATEQTTLLFGLLGVLLAAGAAVWIGRAISKPVEKVTAVMVRIADTGETDVTIPCQEQRDEIGTMARALETFRESLVRQRTLEDEQRRRETEAAEEKRAAMQAMADRFEQSVGQVVTTLTRAADRMQKESQALSTAAEQTAQQSKAADEAARGASESVQSVSAASEELASSIAEISRQVADSSRMTGAATSEAVDTNRRVEGLNEAAQRIGNVVQLISEIAEQTNLLALNATIEAARAGDAGKGFAVVASEVKSLAMQTAKATDEIRQQVEQIQSETGSAAAAIGEVTQTIQQVEEIGQSLAVAVEEQGAATQEIARNAQTASDGTDVVTRNVDSVSQAAVDSRQRTGELQDVVDDLVRESSNLQHAVDDFLGEVRAA